MPAPGDAQRADPRLLDRMRKRYPVIVLLILLAAVALSASLVTAIADALPTFTNAVGGIGPCETCQTQAATHAVPSVSGPGSRGRSAAGDPCGVEVAPVRSSCRPARSPLMRSP